MWERKNLKSLQYWFKWNGHYHESRQAVEPRWGCQGSKFSSFFLWPYNSGNKTTLQPCEQTLMDLSSIQTILSLFWICYFLYNAQLSSSVVTVNERWFQLLWLQNLPKGRVIMEEERSTRTSPAATDFTAGWWLGDYCTVTRFPYIWNWNTVFERRLILTSNW